MNEEELEDLSAKLGELLPLLPEKAEEVIALLHERDRLERLGTTDAGRMTFDLVVRPHVWRLVAINDLRREMTAKIALEDRARFYWWTEGSAIDPSAVVAMTSVAHLVATFPDAQRRLDALVQAQEAWTGAKPKPQRAVGRRTLRELLRPPQPSELALAAAPTDERTVVTTSDVEISFASPNLIVDLLADRRSGVVPSIVTAEGEHVLGEVVVGAEERFSFALSEKALDSTRLVIVVPLVSGDVEIVIP